MGIGAAIAGGVAAAGSVASGIIGSNAATSAANTQAGAAKYAADLQYKMFQESQANLRPFATAGVNAFTSLQKLTGTNPASAGSAPAAPPWASSTNAATEGDVQTAYQTLLGRTPDPAGLAAYVGKPLNEIYSAITGGTEYSGLLASGGVPGSTGATAAGNPLTAPLTAPFASTPGAQLDALKQTPGYQFTLDQGTKAITNQFSAGGLGGSGAFGKGLVNYAEGLASTTYQQQFQNYLNQNLQIANILQNQANTGESAAAQAGSQAIQAGASIGDTATSGAAATAGGIAGSAKALTGGISNLSGLGLLYGNQLQGIFGGPSDVTLNALSPKLNYDPSTLAPGP